MPRHYRSFARLLDRFFALVGNKCGLFLSFQNHHTAYRRSVVAYGLLDYIASDRGRSVLPHNSTKENTMARGRPSKSIKVIARQRLEDGAWGIPESPEFSSVQQLMTEIQSQTIQEERLLSRYREIAQESTDPLIRFLLDLVVTDEERHHELTSRMISRLRDELSLSRLGTPKRRAGGRHGKTKPLIRSLDLFIEAERSAIQEYEKLKQESEGLARDVFALLYTTMIHDSQKHVGILEFLRARLSEAASHDKTEVNKL
jgi:rubrerythrin